VGLLSAACTALVGLVLLWSDSGLVSLSYDTTFWLRDDVATTNALIVYMDEASHESLAQPWDKPWDRAWHARLIDRLHALGARVIAFDVLFEGRSDAAADAQLVDAARRSGHVVVAAVADPVLVHSQSVGSTTRRAFPELAAVTTSGVVEQRNEDQIIRRHFFDPDQTNLVSLACATAARAGAAPPAFTGQRWINYYGPPVFLPSLSYREIFETNDALPLMAAISNRVVFVGARYSVGFTGGKATDDFRTPYSAWSGARSPGVEINATTFLNLVRHDWLTRLPPVPESFLVLLAGLFLGIGLWNLRPHVAALVAVLGAMLFAAAMVMVAGAARIWFPWCLVVLVQLPVALAFSIIGQSRQLAREKRAFEQALALTSEGRGTSTAAPSADGAGGSGPSPGAPDSQRPMVLPEFLRQPVLPVPATREDLPRVPDHELIRCIGRGGYGEVWLSRDILGSFQAVKLLHLRDFSSATPLQTEFEGLKRFTPISRSHPGLLHILHVGRDESKACLYYVMELADDDSAAAATPAFEEYVPRTLARDLARLGRLELVDAVNLGIALAEALHHLHTQQLVHRDIKPANIVYVKGHPKLADVGLVTAAATHPNGALFLGTPGRIAPEGAGTPLADVFSLGKVLYEAGLGMDVARFPELPASMIQSGADRNLFEFNRLIMRACDVDPGGRWASAAELANALRQLRQRLPKPIQSGPSRAGKE
jgi:CHASE2 domain-containing sensor protein